MSQLIIEFPLPNDAAVLGEEHLSVDLGNGVKLTTSIPDWVKYVKEIKLQLVMEIDGSPHADTGETPVE